MYTKTAAKSGKKWQKVAKMADFFAVTFARGFPPNVETNFVNEQKASQEIFAPLKSSEQIDVSL
jgi:hypothetical protein